MTAIVFPMSVGKRVAGLRKSLGLTQPELSKLSGIAQGTLSELETGESKVPRGGTLVRLAKALQVDPDWLVTGQGTPSRPTKPGEDEQELLSLFGDMTAANRLALIATARALVSSQPTPTPASPFKRIPAKERK